MRGEPQRFSFMTAARIERTPRTKALATLAVKLQRNGILFARAIAGIDLYSAGTIERRKDGVQLG
jgi:hypothetical protein